MNVVKADKQKQFEDYLTKFEAALSKEAGHRHPPTTC
jgi:hypothetical protein